MKVLSQRCCLSIMLPCGLWENQIRLGGLQWTTELWMLVQPRKHLWLPNTRKLWQQLHQGHVDTVWQMWSMVVFCTTESSFLIQICFFLFGNSLCCHLDPQGYHSSPTIYHTHVSHMPEKLQPESRKHVVISVWHFNLLSHPGEIKTEAMEEVLPFLIETGLKPSR